MTRPWVVVTGHFVRTSGQGRANLALAEFLQERGDRVHLVASAVEPSLERAPGVTVHRVWYPLGSHALGERLLDRVGQRVAREVTRADPRARVVVNGGNCHWFDVNWVHLVHHAWPEPPAGGSLAFKLRSRIAAALDRRRERVMLSGARLVLANSEQTRREVTDLIRPAPRRVEVVALGSDGVMFQPPTPEEQAQAREELRIQSTAKVIAFVGVHGPDLRKGFDTLLDAFAPLARIDPTVLLVTAGSGMLDRWRSRIDALGLASRVRLLGHTPHIRRLLASADLLAAPSRYEPYGLNVHEALCMGVPAITTVRAGVAERYPEDLQRLVLREIGDSRALLELLSWSLAHLDELRERVNCLGERLRSRSWATMAAELVARIEELG